MKKTPSGSIRKTKTRNLTLLLIRKEFKSPAEALKDAGLLDEWSLPGDFEFEGSLHVSKPPLKEPRWASFVKEGFPEEIEFSQSATAAAVLFIKADSRMFAVTFGQGRHLLKPDSYEIDFGLKVTLNTVDQRKLRSLDLRTFEELTVHTRRQVSRSSSLEAFNVDVFRDLLGSVTGEPSDESLAKRLTGRDALAFSGAIAFPDLADKCKTLLGHYRSELYKTNFPWVDNVRQIRDASTIDRLNDKLVRAINAHDMERIHLAPPEVIEWNDVSFLYPGEHLGTVEAHIDLDLGDCLAALASREGVEPEDFHLSLETLKQQKIRTVSEDASLLPERWSLYKCLVAELNEEGALCILSAGQWFKVEKTFAAQTLEDTVALVKDIKHLPVALPNQEEGDYNELAAGSRKHLVLLDRKNKKAKGARTAIEACDLFSASGQFIHVKRKLRSSSLSHLFSQGTVAAETFLGDEKFRKDVKKAVAEQNPIIAGRLGDPTKRPDPSRYEVVFAIMTTTPQAKWPQALPFFSQLNLVRKAAHLRLLGFQVALYRIEERK
ncbi:hypothetical protein F0U62_30205 [Cystobacter fuscus]|uniref:DUF6119 family protein n=1 Tax=Cystobacter fuscus TaxID=43 RepID=UPI002B2B4242|nr:hypothetical protein F0U62_30205 [Cystobacter fuscus]